MSAAGGFAGAERELVRRFYSLQNDQIAAEEKRDGKWPCVVGKKLVKLERQLGLGAWLGSCICPAIGGVWPARIEFPPERAEVSVSGSRFPDSVGFRQSVIR